MSSAVAYVPPPHMETAAAPGRDSRMSNAFAPRPLFENAYQQAGKVNLMSTVALSKAASLATLISVIIAAIGIIGQIIFGGLIFGMLSALALAILAAIVISHSG
jgi:hypothetical protein